MRLLGAYTRLYGAALRLYPQPFRGTYADEMVEVFVQAMTDQRGAGLRLLARELLRLPIHALRQRWRLPEPPELRSLRRARWLTRGVCLLLALFFLQTLGAAEIRYDGRIYTQALPFLFMLRVAVLAPLVAWRWEQIGGWVTILAGAGMAPAALYLVLSVHLADGTQSNGSALPLLLSALWGLPFLIFGGLFLAYHRRARALAVALAG